MLLYLAGVNEHAVLRTVGIKRWSVAYFLRTVSFQITGPSESVEGGAQRDSA